jgi:hypothetical protein
MRQGLYAYVAAGAALMGSEGSMVPLLYFADAFVRDMAIGVAAPSTAGDSPGLDLQHATRDAR